MRTANSYGYRVWSRADIEGVLAALYVANRDLTERVGSTEAELYNAGYVGALRAVGQMFGIELPMSDRVFVVEAEVTVDPIHRGLDRGIPGGLPRRLPAGDERAG